MTACRGKPAGGCSSPDRGISRWWRRAAALSPHGRRGKAAIPVRGASLRPVRTFLPSASLLLFVHEFFFSFCRFDFKVLVGWGSVKDSSPRFPSGRRRSHHSDRRISASSSSSPPRCCGMHRPLSGLCAAAVAAAAATAGRHPPLWRLPSLAWARQLRAGVVACARGDPPTPDVATPRGPALNGGSGSRGDRSRQWEGSGGASGLGAAAAASWEAVGGGGGAGDGFATAARERLVINGTGIVGGKGWRFPRVLGNGAWPGGNSDGGEGTSQLLTRPAAAPSPVPLCPR